MAKHVTKNAIKGRQGFQRTGRTDPTQVANIQISPALLGLTRPADAPTGYEDIHLAFKGGQASGPLLDYPGAGATQQSAPADEANDKEFAVELAHDSETDADTLDYIAKKNTDPAVLAAVAKHPNTNPSTLHLMAMNLDHRDFEDVICRIGENQTAEPETMRLLATSTSEKVKVWAAWHDNTPADCHLSFRDHTNAAVRQGSAENPGAPSETLFYLGNALYEGDGPCRTAAKSNPQYPSVEDRLNLASSNKTPVLEREMLAWDTNAKVRRAAKEYFGDNRPSSDDLFREAKRRNFPRHVVEGIARRKVALEDKTSAVVDA